jgi:iron complex transport system ATP-binding protein
VTNQSTHHGSSGRPSPVHAAGLAAHGLALDYGRTPVVHDVALTLRPGSVTALIGPNGSGKSTALRAIARLHRLRAGTVRIEHAEGARDAAVLDAREFARTVAMLSQSRPHPSGLEVRDVVAFGRHPHRGRFSGLRDDDRAAIDRALALTGLAAMAARPVDELSGGELQRVWLATALAQTTPILLLDEPTNHLDLRYQIETLDLIRDLADAGTALGVVLHDLDHAAAVADRVVLLHAGRVRAEGTPADVLTSENLSAAYGLRIDTAVDDDGRVRVFPRGRRGARRTPVPQPA